MFAKSIENLRNYRTLNMAVLLGILDADFRPPLPLFYHHEWEYFADVHYMRFSESGPVCPVLVLVWSHLRGSSIFTSSRIRTDPLLATTVHVYCDVILMTWWGDVISDCRPRHLAVEQWVATCRAVWTPRRSQPCTACFRRRWWWSAQTPCWTSAVASAKKKNNKNF